jgi:hypothetical protein
VIERRVRETDQPIAVSERDGEHARSACLAAKTNINPAARASGHASRDRTGGTANEMNHPISKGMKSAPSIRAKRDR